MVDYVHGYSSREARRLVDQAGAVCDLLHYDSVYPTGSVVLEAGCGVGAQTITLARQNPDVSFVSIDISPESLGQARSTIEQAGLTNVEFQQADIFNLPFAPASFDHMFICYVLEHLPNPEAALRKLLAVLKPGGTLTAIEGDHGSAYFHPDSPAARQAIQCLIDLQARMGGDSLIGRRLYPLLVSVGLKDVRVSPRMVYADASRPALVEGFTKLTFTAMVEGVREQALDAGMITPQVWDRGVADLYRTAKADGTFSYTFFKAVGVK
ncbi:MAG: methyltransferase domain-containing protein [Sedimentisphaerales bacterium]|nr:methyltransferase domain-containing protein [Sedimentisphaerales bacterium]